MVIVATVELFFTETTGDSFFRFDVCIWDKSEQGINIFMRTAKRGERRPRYWQRSEQSKDRTRDRNENCTAEDRDDLRINYECAHLAARLPRYFYFRCVRRRPDFSSPPLPLLLWEKTHDCTMIVLHVNGSNRGPSHRLSLRPLAVFRSVEKYIFQRDDASGIT